MAREEIPLREITIEELYKDIQKLRSEFQAHNHLDIGNAQILTGTLKGITQSSNFVSGSAGAQINWATGNVEFNSGNFRGDISGASGTFTGSISIGSGNNIFKADANGIYLGHATFGSAPFRVTMAGALVATSATITGAITISSGSGIANLSDAGDLAVLDVVGDAQFSGTLTVGKTEAKCTDANADQTSANTAADIAGQGALATQSTVGAGDCDATIISGGKIITGLLTATNIQTGTLTARNVKSAAAGTNRLEIIAGGYTAYITWWDSGNNLESFLVDDFAGHLAIFSTAYVQISNALDVQGNITLTGTVDGIDINAFGVSYNSHVGNASAHHSSVSNGLNITPASVNVGAGNILGSGNLGSSSYEWSSLYFAAGGGIKAGTYTTNRLMQFISYAGNGKIILGEGSWHANLVPMTSGKGYIGTVAEHFYQVTADRIRYDTDSVVFQTHDDIKLLKEIKAVKKEGKDVWDKKSFPKEIVEDDMYDVATMQGFLVGTIKQLVERLESLENSMA